MLELRTAVITQQRVATKQRHCGGQPSELHVAELYETTKRTITLIDGIQLRRAHRAQRFSGELALQGVALPAGDIGKCCAQILRRGSIVALLLITRLPVQPADDHQNNERGELQWLRRKFLHQCFSAWRAP